MTGVAKQAEQSPEIEFWFEFGSNYSYLSVMRIEEEARRHGVQIAWKPFLLGPIFRALGMENSPFVLQKEKGAYVQHDMARLCRKYGLAPWVKPSVFPRLGVLPLRIALLGVDEPWIGAFCRKVMELNFVRDQDINQPAHVGQHGEIARRFARADRFGRLCGRHDFPEAVSDSTAGRDIGDLADRDRQRAHCACRHTPRASAYCGTIIGRLVRARLYDPRRPLHRLCHLVWR